jgi:hypothetical protein
MASAIAGFIDYDGDGKPFMGLLIQDQRVEVKIYLSHKDKAFEVVGELTRQLNLMAGDLIKMKNQLVAANGSELNGSVRKS